MPSLRARMLSPVLRRLLKPRLSGEASLATQRAAVLNWAKLGRMPWGVSVERRTLGGRPAERFALRDGEISEAPVLLLHGGGYCWGGLASHREFAARTARAARRPVWVVDYRLAPEAPYPAALDDCTSALVWMRDHADELGVRSDQLIVIGESAGGGPCAFRLFDRAYRDREGVV